MDREEEIEDKDVANIDRRKAFDAPERIALVARYVLEHFDQKTYSVDKTYVFKAPTNIADVASAERGKVEEVRKEQRVRGFNSIFAASSVPAAMAYYEEFRWIMKEDPTKNLKIAVIFSCAANEEEKNAEEQNDGILGEENSEDTSGLDQTARDFLQSAINDYNEMFGTSYDVSGDKFQNYYKDVSLRMKNRELDMLVVVNMFLTGFDATTLNTLWVDKNLKMHGLIQAFSRTNRILNSVKTCGNIVCFRPLQKRVDEALALFGDKGAGGIVLMRRFEDYYSGYLSAEGKDVPGYRDLIEKLTGKFPLGSRIVGEQNEREFISLFGSILRMRNLLLAFDEFQDQKMRLLAERDFQDYCGKYQDLRDEWIRIKKQNQGKKVDITDDVVFEIELIQQIDVNIDYILALVQKYHDSHCQDGEIRASIAKAVGASPELRNKKKLIDEFIAELNETDDVVNEWNAFVARRRARDLETIIREEKLKPKETRKFIEQTFRYGEVKTTGTDIDGLMPPMSRFGNSNRANKKRAIVEKLKRFFENYSGVGKTFKIEEEEPDGSET